MQTPLQHAVAIKVGVYLKLVGEVENKWILTYFGAYSVRKVPADKIPASLPSSTRNLVFAAREFSSMLLCHEWTSQLGTYDPAAIKKHAK